MHDYDTDIKSYQRRINEEYEKAKCYLDFGSYDKLLVSAGKLLSMARVIEELQYQEERVLCASENKSEG